MEEILVEFGLRDGLFAALFIWLLLHQMRTSKEREDKLYGFLNDMKDEFAKLVASYDSLSYDVTDIKTELKNKMDKEERERK